MADVNVAIIYYSATGTNYQMATVAAEAAKAIGANVRVRKVTELAPRAAIDSNPAWAAHVDATKDVETATLDDLEWADAVIFSMATRFGTIPSQMKQFIDIAGPLWAQGKLANKVVSAMSSAGNAHGGQENSILSLYSSMFHWGAIIAAPGYTDDSIFGAGGNPYGTSVTQSQDGTIAEESLAAIRHQAKRTVEVAGWVKQGQA